MLETELDEIVDELLEEEIKLELTRLELSILEDRSELCWRLEDVAEELFSLLDWVDELEARLESCKEDEASAEDLLELKIVEEIGGEMDILELWSELDTSLDDNWLELIFELETPDELESVDCDVKSVGISSCVEPEDFRNPELLPVWAESGMEKPALGTKLPLWIVPIMVTWFGKPSLTTKIA